MILVVAMLMGPFFFFLSLLKTPVTPNAYLPHQSRPK